MNSRKIILAIFCGFAIAIIVLLVINKIKTTPQQIPATAQPTLELIRPAFPTEVSAPVSKEIIFEKEYPKQVMVGLRSWSYVESAKKIIVDSGGQIVKVLKWPTKNVIIAVLPDKNAEQKILKNTFWGKLVGGIGFSDFGNELSGGIDYVEKDLKVPAQAINSIDWGVTRIKADKVWKVSTGKGVKVAIIDSGIQRDHPDLVANIKGGISFMPGSPDQWDDESGHGTKVAGLIAAANNDIGYVGVAPEASLYAVKVMGKDGLAATSDMLSGIYWAADNGMDIVNLSLGQHLDPVYSSRSIADETEAANYAYSRGVVLVASSGNDINGNCDKVIYPAAITSAVIAVGATLRDNSIAYFSCYGPEVELSAPGSYNNVPIMGSSYGYGNGTSIAAPFVAGVAALILSKNPEFTPAQVRERLNSTAFDLGAPGRDKYYGYGLVNAYDSLFPSAPPVTIILISPKGGEQWWQGIEKEVNWKMDNVPAGEKVEKVDIQLIHQHGNAIEAIPLAIDAINNGKTLVDVPSGLPVTSATDSYFLQISCAKSFFIGQCQPAKSGPLNITAVPPQAFKVLYPNGGEQWPQGTTQSVLWTANYFGGANVDIALLEKKQVPTYSFISGSQINTCFDHLNCQGWANGWSGYDPYSVWQVGYAAGSNPVQPPPDTCDGNIKRGADGGKFSCPATNSSDHLTCTDVAESNNTPKFYWARTVNCSYQPSPPFHDLFETAKTLAENIVNKGSAEISVPSDMMGSNYLIQLSCANFTGECSKGLSNASFNIINLADSVTLTINKSGVSGVGVVTDKNIICSSNRSACLENYERGAAVTLSAASVDSAVIFSGWSGACSGTGTCQITMDSDQSVIATFSTRAVTLTAIPDLGTTFTGWSGDCLKNGQCSVSWSNACATDIPCNITMSKDQSVTANFIKNPVIEIDRDIGGSGCASDTWTCSPWVPEICPVSGQQTRVCVRDCQNGTSPPPSTSQSCAYKFTPGPIREINPSQ